VLYTRTLQIRAMHCVDWGNNEETGEEKSCYGADIINIAEHETRCRPDEKPVSHSGR
jgi:hypothetical protein